MENIELAAEEKCPASEGTRTAGSKQMQKDIARPLIFSSRHVLSVEDLMDVLHIGRNTAYNLVQSGKIRSIKIGRIYHIPLEAVDEFLKDENG